MAPVCGAGIATFCAWFWRSGNRPQVLIKLFGHVRSTKREPRTMDMNAIGIGICGFALGFFVAGWLLWSVTRAERDFRLKSVARWRELYREATGSLSETCVVLMREKREQRDKYEARIAQLEADADPEALQIVYWKGYYAGRDAAKAK